MVSTMETEYKKIKEKVLAMLSQQLDEKLKYHSVHHTIDVLCQCERIALAEGIKNERQLQQLKIAALYHDTGFLFVYKEHEKKSCEIFRQQLKDAGLLMEDMEVICSLIMATKIPQQPKTKLEEIICDADLDYLGRNDFEQISNNLKKEFFDYGFVDTEEEWLETQIKFFEAQRYFTKTAQQTRTQKKLDNLEALKIRAAAIMSNK